MKDVKLEQSHFSENIHLSWTQFCNNETKHHGFTMFPTYHRSRGRKLTQNTLNAVYELQVWFMAFCAGIPPKRSFLAVPTFLSFEIGIFSSPHCSLEVYNFVVDLTGAYSQHFALILSEDFELGLLNNVQTTKTMKAHWNGSNAFCIMTQGQTFWETRSGHVWVPGWQGVELRWLTLMVSLIGVRTLSKIHL